MSSPKQSSFTIDTWNGCYKDGWKGLIVEAAFAHPAKYARGLIRRIYEHALDESWLIAGDVVVDPFGGIALGGFDAAMHGAHWIGCELEEKFVGLGNENIEEWKHRYGHRAGYGSARLIQGDSRKLSEVLKEAQIAVGSPPYNLPMSQDHNGSRGGTRGTLPSEDGTFVKYGNTPGQLEGLPMTEAGLNLAITSPPFSPDQPCASQTRAPKDYEAQKHGTKRDHVMTSEGNLSAMKEGDFSLVVSSPPFVESLASDNPEKRGGLFRDPKRKNDKTLTATYGTEPGQLGAMKESSDGFTLAVSSPPYADQQVGTGSAERTGWRGYTDHGGGTSSQEAQLASKSATKEGFDLSVSSPPYEGNEKHDYLMSEDGKTRKRDLGRGYKQGHGSFRGNYGDAEGQLSKEVAEDFWSAARLIIEQTYLVLAPGAHAVWVVKGFVRNKTYVDFPDQWRQLCEAVGFKTLHWHEASLVERSGVQHTLDGGEDKIETQRKSFFRRLAELKGSPAIDAEIVLCMIKPSGKYFHPPLDTPPKQVVDT